MATNANNNKTNKKTNTKAVSSKGKTAASSKAKRPTKRESKESILIGDITLTVFIGLTIILYLANFGLCGKAGATLTNLTFGLFGTMGYVSPLLVLIAVCFLVSNKNKLSIIYKSILVLGLVIITGSIICLFSVVEFNEAVTWKIVYDFSMKGGRAGGLLGNAPTLFLCPKFGKAATFIILLIVWIILFLILTDFSIIGWIGYRVEDYKANSDTAHEIKRIKQETRQNKLEQKIEQKRKLNEEKMLSAMQAYEASLKDNAKSIEDESNVRLGRTGSLGPIVTRPAEKSTTSSKIELTEDISDVIPEEKTAKTSTKPKQVVLPGKPIKRSDAEERKLIPSFLLSDEEFDQKTNDKPITDEPEAEKNVDQIIINLPAEDSVPETNEFSDDNKVMETGFVLMPDPDAPIRKPFPKTKDEDERIIEMAGGKTINSSLGMGGTKAVEAEGTEKDPHGIGREYEPDEDEKIKAELEKATIAKAPEKKYKYPPTSLLKKNEGGVKNNREQLKETAERLQSVLQSFGVGARVTDVTCGPSVTRYELTPDTGVKVSKIVGLQDDIKLNLAAADIRIEAPIPGKAAVGIEVPNKVKSGVTLREMLECSEFKEHKSKLAFTVGKDIGGANIIGDIAKMPHLLIAGTTGSGKSVSVNTIIVSMLYHAAPSEVKLLMIDPKVVELKVYNGIPHLLRPVITDVKQASGALNWAVTEMNRRYKLFAESNVRDLAGFNEKVKEQAIYGDIGGLKPLPQIVIIVDELADLMMSAPAEVEDSIQHIAQMGRASGMHLILITQRPTVNVVTGTIKANVPSRIALTVASGTDSRTMIDMVGAEKLLGNGDMLYFPVGMQKPIRLQGPYVGDEEINSIVDFLKNQGNVEGGGVDESVDKQIAESTSKKEAAEAKQEEDDKDDLLFDAGKFIIESDKASIGMLQRKFRIGFNRAARIMDTLAELGVVGPEEGTKPRNIIMNVVQFENLMKK